MTHKPITKHPQLEVKSHKNIKTHIPYKTRGRAHTKTHTKQRKMNSNEHQFRELVQVLAIWKTPIHHTDKEFAMFLVFTCTSKNLFDK